jgi:hypothetical protein
MVGFLPGRVFSGRLILVGFLRSAYYGRLIDIHLKKYIFAPSLFDSTLETGLGKNSGKFPIFNRQA